MTKVLFVANFHLTELMVKIAKNLEQDNVECHFIYFSSYFMKRYLSEIEDHKLHYPKNVFSRTNSHAFAPDYTFANINLSEHVVDMISNDRVMKNWSKSASVNSLNRFSIWIDKLLTSQSFDLVISESTWTAERIIFEISRKKNVHYVTPSSVRYPPRCWFFSDDFGPIKLSERSPIVNRVSFDGVRLFGTENYKLDWSPEIKRRKSLFISAMIFKEKLQLIGESENNPTQRSVVDYLRSDSPVRIRLRKPFISLINTMLKKGVSDSQNFVFATIHVQPESSIDAYATHVANQISTFRKIAENLPEKWLLLVKDHPSGLGNRSILDYIKLMAHPRIRMVSAKVRSSEFLTKARYIYTATGTIAIEASIAGGKALLATDTFFSHLPGIFVHTEPWNFDWDMHLSDGPLNLAERQNQCDTFFRFFLSRCYSGIWGEGGFSPLVLSRSNIDELSQAVLQYLRASPIKS